MGTAVLENDGHTHTVLNLNGPPKSSLIFPHPYTYSKYPSKKVPSHPAPLSKNAWFSGASSSWRSGSVRATARSTSVPVAAAAGVWRRSWTAWDESWRSARWWTQATIARLRYRKIYGKTWWYITGWWFGTVFIFPYIGKNSPIWLIFFRGVETTNQIIYGKIW
jgi:hypothetical protein